MCIVYGSQSRLLPSAVCCLPSLVFSLPCAVCPLPSAVCRLPSTFTVCRLLSVVCPLLSAVCCMPTAVRSAAERPVRLMQAAECRACGELLPGGAADRRPTDCVPETTAGNLQLIDGLGALGGVWCVTAVPAARLLRLVIVRRAARRSRNRPAEAGTGAGGPSRGGRSPSRRQEVSARLHQIPSACPGQTAAAAAATRPEPSTTASPLCRRRAGLIVCKSSGVVTLSAAAPLTSVAARPDPTRPGPAPDQTRPGSVGAERGRFARGWTDGWRSAQLLEYRVCGKSWRFFGTFAGSGCDWLPDCRWPQA